MVAVEFDNDETLLRGYIPLHKFKNLLDDAESSGIEKITFIGNGHCTDAVLKLFTTLSPKCYARLEEVNLSGCSMITDTGIHWLSQVTRHAPNLKIVSVNGCSKLTDASAALLHHNIPVGCKLFVMATSIRHLSRGLRSTVDTTGCPLLTLQPGKLVEFRHDHILVVPQCTVTSSVTEYLTSKTVEDRTAFCQKSGWLEEKWNFTVSELTTNNPLFDQIVTNNCTQVIIPFDVISEITEIKEHIMSTVSRVLAKENVCPHYPTMPKSSIAQSGYFMERYKNLRSTLSDDGVMSNLGSTEKQIGAFWSNQPLTRSNNYFEVECLETTGYSEQVAVLLGIVHDVLFFQRNPMDSTEKEGGVVDGFELVPGNVYGFGIEGDWDSEYVPTPGKSRYYFTRNSQKVVNKKTEGQPHIGMYPLLAVLGRTKGQIKISNFAVPPLELCKQWEAEDRWIDHGFSNLLVDRNGIVTYGVSSLDVGRVGIFISGTAVSAVHNSCTIKILSLGERGTITIGFGPENYPSGHQPGWKSPSIALHVDDGRIYLGSNPEGIIPNDGEVKFAVGDEITLKVGNINSKSGLVDPGDDVQIFFYKNGKKVYETVFSFKVDKGVRGVFMIGMHSMKEKVHLINYKPPYRVPAPIPEKLTMGRSHFIDVYDNGTLKYRKFDTRNLFGLFLAKSPLNRKLLYFEMAVLACSENTVKRHIAIGLCHPNYGGNNIFPGWCEGSIAYHADNGKIYCSMGQGIGDAAVYGDGDVVGCGVEVCHGELKFDQNGYLSSQQTVQVYFTKNGERVHVYNFDCDFNGLYPCCAMDNEEDSVKLHNFYPETKTLIEAMKAEADSEETHSGHSDEFGGCEFIIVGCSAKGSDVSSKVQMVKDQISLPDDLLGRSAVQKQIDNLEKHIESLDLQGQENYAGLCRVLNNLDNLSQHPERLHFIMSDLHSEEGYAAVKNQIISTQECRYKHQTQRYQLPDLVKDWLETIVDAVMKGKILTVKEIQDCLETAVTGRICMEMLKHLHEMGRVFLLLVGSKYLVLDVTYLMEVVERLTVLSSVEICNSQTISVGESTHVWTKSTLETVICKGIDANKMQMFQEVLQMYGGLITLPCLRTKMTDEMFVATTLPNITRPPVTLRDYWSNSCTVPNFVTIQGTYSFPQAINGQILALILSTTSRYGRVLLMTSEGMVLQNGAIQTVIIKHKGELAEAVISVESKCFFPEETQEPVNSLTKSCVEEYVWNVFCIFIDVIDDIIQRQKVAAIVMRDSSNHLVNTSVGCKHKWVLSEDKHKQSVCTLCNRCCDKGSNCAWNGIIGDYLRECGCETTVSGCKNCGICKSCATELWDVRSRLRPYLKPTESVLHERPLVSLDPFVYNEVEFTNLSQFSNSVCLKEIVDGTLIQIFPGKAVQLVSKDTDKIKEKLKEYNNKATFEKNYRFSPGDQLRIRLLDLLGASTKMLEDMPEEKFEVRPVYHALHCREVKVCHETGILCYDTGSSSLPVGQFIGPKPLSAECNKFSIKIMDGGESRYIGIGVCHRNYPPNRQPGWNNMSLAFHADDGGIYLESGFPSHRKTKCVEGDIMECEMNFKNRMVYFKKNGSEVFKIKVNFPRGGFYPVVGFHSLGEAVKFMEKEPWTPPNDDPSFRPTAFDTYKYGNLSVSPGKSLGIKKVGGYGLYGWLNLHNPSRETIGYIVSPGHGFTGNTAGSLTPGQNILLRTTFEPKKCPDEVKIDWLSLESGRQYSVDNIKQLYNTSTGESLHSHRLRVKIEDASLGDVENLPRVEDGTPENTNVYSLQVYKNETLLDEYWLKTGNYLVELPDPQGDFIMQYPKCPTYNYSSGFQRGMKIVAYIASINDYAECVIVEVCAEPNPHLLLEYSPVGAAENATMDMPIDSNHLQFTEWSETSAIILYEPRGNEVQEKRIFIPAPSYLLAEGSKKALEALDSDWMRKATEESQRKKDVLRLDSQDSKGEDMKESQEKQTPLELLDSSWRTKSLRAFSQCQYIFNRFTVQEQEITKLSRNLNIWLKGSGSGPDDQVDHAFTFLPKNLDMHMLSYPIITDIFKDLAVHRLCYGRDQVVHFETSRKVTLMIPMHFVDIPGIVPSQKLPTNLMFASVYSGLTYTSLVAYRTKLPSYSQMFSGDTKSFSRQQIETLLHGLLMSYTALCHIFSAQYGGLQYQELTHNSTARIESEIAHADTNLVPFKGEPITDHHTLVKQQKNIHCKAHGICIDGNNSVYSDDLVFSYDYFEPYEDTVTAFSFSLPYLESLPDDFFDKFPNLQYFALEGSYQIKSLPKGISKCKLLETVSLRRMTLTELPEDMLQAPAITTLECSCLLIKQLPNVWPVNSQLTRLVLSGLLIEKVPAEISNLEHLLELDLDYNPITTLPDELSKLTKLKVLRLTGIPWITYEGVRTQMTKEQYMAWFYETPYAMNYWSKEVIDDMFTEYDINHNSILDEDEMSQMNIKFLFGVPRIGIQDINDEVYGGFPPVIFKLTRLEELYLDFQAITQVPQFMNNLQNLCILSLNHNPLLESLPGSLGHLPNIRSIKLMSCPFLRTPPNEVVSRGFESVKAYLKRLAGGFTECRRTKLMFVGLGGAGKTSLLKALMSVDKCTSSTQGGQLTDGIEIQPWTVRTKENVDVTFSTWDFAGQTVYYNTHQFFLSKRAVYLLLWSMRMGFEHAGLDFWLSSICCHAPNTPIVVVGTALDQVAKANLPESDIKARYPQIVGFHYVSCTEGTNIANLEQHLLSVTLQQIYMREKVPQVWLNLEKKILVERASKSILKWDTVQEFAMEVGIYDEKDVREAVQFLHDLGTLQYFDNDFLRDQVVINPQWIVNVMACVVSVKKSPIQMKKGRFHHDDIPTVWSEYNPELHQWLLRLTEEFDLTFPLPKEPINIVPCLLPHEEPRDLQAHWPKVDPDSGIRETKMVYKFAYLPAGLFNRAQVRLFQFSDGKLIWKKGSLLKKNQHLALIRQISDSELVVLVQGPRPENILFLIHEVFEGLIEESFHGVKYDYFVPCPDCISKEGTKEPCLFDSSLVRRARDHKAPFLQCYKYFHTVSMAELQQVMPADSALDFDVHLQQSISTLQELNNAMSTDVTILYSQRDMPGKNDINKADPSRVRDDLMAAGYTCWFEPDMDSVEEHDLTMAVKNCKVVVVLLSDQFEKDHKCRDMLVYAKEILSKPYIIAFLGETMDYKNTDLGMIFGPGEVMCMIKTKDRYHKKIEELKQMVHDKLLGIKEEQSKQHLCFISYAWANSHEAVNECKTRGKPGSLGWDQGDPRKIKRSLEKHNISCWLDIENTSTGMFSVYRGITHGLNQCRLVVVCVSDQYAESENCMMEMRFAVFNMNRPIVLAIVGTGSSWEQSEAGLLMHRCRAEKVDFRTENPSALEAFLKTVKEKMPKKEEVKKKHMQEFDKMQAEKAEITKKKKKVQQQSNISYQEEYELIQRKFMRHLLSSISVADTAPLPRLVVFDFAKTTPVGPRFQRMDSTNTGVTGIDLHQQQQQIQHHQSSQVQQQQQIQHHQSSQVQQQQQYSSHTGGLQQHYQVQQQSRLRPKGTNRSREHMKPFNLEEEEDDWEMEEFCVKILCEHEEGWHLCDKPLFLRQVNIDAVKEFLSKAAPYLVRIYAILRQSSIKLNCLGSKKGDKFLKWMEEQALDNMSLGESYVSFRQAMSEHEEVLDIIRQLDRCHLPSGKIFWLCETHQNGSRITKLSLETGTQYAGHRTLFREDRLLKEYLEANDIYREKKGIKSKGRLPPPPKLRLSGDIDFGVVMPRKRSINRRDGSPDSSTRARSKFKAAGTVADLTTSAEHFSHSHSSIQSRASTTSRRASKTCSIQ